MPSTRLPGGSGPSIRRWPWRSGASGPDCWRFRSAGVRRPWPPSTRRRGWTPSHPLVAAERLELAELLGQSETADAVAREHVDAAASDDEAVDCALLHAVAARRGGRDAAAAAILEMPRVQARRAGRPNLRAFNFAAAASRHDAAALAEWWLVEAALADGEGPDDTLAHPLAFAGCGNISSRATRGRCRGRGRLPACARRLARSSRRFGSTGGAPRHRRSTPGGGGLSRKRAGLRNGGAARGLGA